MARYPSAGQVLWVGPVKAKVKKVGVEKPHHRAVLNINIKTQKIISVKGNLVPPFLFRVKG
ncbi:MAG: hypothetical protein H6Q41_3238 [Deltaproteobacteria bacterium]|nr:hypothetical protein [Deltaproteobacteria bacterium]